MPKRSAAAMPDTAADLVLTWTPGGVRPAPASELPRGRRQCVYGSSAGLTKRDTDRIIGVLKGGLPVSAFGRLQLEMGVSAKVLAATTNIAVRTLTRRKKEGRLRTDESERLYRIAALFDRAVEVLGDKGKARDWFAVPKRAFAGRTPLEQADTEPGATQVADLLGQIEHGVFA